MKEIDLMWVELNQFEPFPSSSISPQAKSLGLILESPLSFT